MNLANKLTLSRMIMIPFFIASFYLPTQYWYLVASFLFILAFVTDLLDGSIARSRNMITDFGKFMDPIADKLLTLSALVMLSSVGKTISPVITIIILGREFIVSGLRLVAASGGKVIAASWLGKAKTVSQFIAILFALLLPGFKALFGDWTEIVCQILLWSCTILTLWSGWDYLFSHREHIDHRR